MIDIRPMTDDDLARLREVDDWAFGVTSSDARWAAASGQLERDRQLGAFVGTELAGHAAAFTHELTVPGGLLPAAGVTWVMVSPLHRRQGVLSRLMDHQLADLHEAGEAVATLWASEPAIYPRFGYGLAARRLTATVPRAHRALVGGREEQQPRRLRVGEVGGHLRACRQAYEGVRPHRPGMVSRSDAAWAETAYDDPADRGSGSALRCVLAEDPSGRPTGFAWYRTHVGWEGGSPGGRVDVRELVADDAATTRALLTFLLDLDLTSETVLWNLPVDHPLPTLLVDPRRARPTLLDALWVRLVRLDDALRARRYAADVDVVVDVHDDRCPWNAGRWRLSAGPGGAQVARSTAPPDLSLDVTTLASAYLGDDALLPALAAGLIEQHTPGAAPALARAMRGERAPWCSYVF